MGNIATLSVKLIANLKKFVAGMKIAATNVKSFASKVGRSMRTAAAAVKRFAASAARSLGSFVKKWVRRAVIAFGALSIAAIKWAADAEESENLVRESFEGMTDAVIVWSERLQKELGLDAIQLRKQAGFFNLLTLSMGATEKQAFQVSTQLTELAADMASFRNQNFESIFNAMRSGMVGMTRPLQNLGINIKENAVDQLLFAMNIDRTAESLTEQERVLARFISILQATNKDTGDLAHTYDSFTNVIRVMVANAKILAREMGDTLKNAITPLAIRMREWLLNNREDVAVWFKEVVDKFIDFTHFFTSGTWREGLERGLEFSVRLFEAFAETVLVLMVDSFKNIGRASVASMKNAITSGIIQLGLFQSKLKQAGIGMVEAALGIATQGRLGADIKVLNDLKRQTKAEVAKFEAGGGFFGKAPERSVKGVELLKKKIAELGKEMERMAASGKQARIESDKLFAAGAADRARRNEKLRAESKARMEAQLAEAKAQLLELTEASAAAADAVSASWAHVGTSIKAVMLEANDATKDAFVQMLETMAVEMKDFEEIFKQFIVNVMQEIARMQARLVAAKILGGGEQGGLGLSDLIGKGLGFLAGGLGKVASATKDIVANASGSTLGGPNAPGVQGPVLARARGGLVKPVFAANGFAPRGTDTVPAMLTPGEGVLSKGLTQALRDQLAVPGGLDSGPGLTIQVQAIDAQGTATWLNNNKRLIAGMLGETNRGNNPAARRLGGQRR